MYSSLYPEFKRVLEAFTANQVGLGRGKHPAQPAISPLFEDSLNRLLDHESLCSVVGAKGGATSQVRDYWEIGPVVRAKDGRKVSAGLHLSVFEMLASMSFANPAARREQLARMCKATIDFLVDGLGLCREKLQIVSFGGGMVLPGVSVPPEIDWLDAWSRVGITDDSLIQVGGPFMFLLMAGDQERGGATCEILYDVKGDGHGIEIGTAIAHDWVVSASNGEYSLKRAERGVYGIAFGLERLAAIACGFERIEAISVFSSAIESIWSHSAHPAAVRKGLHSDALSLLDMLRLAIFLEAFPDDKAAPGVRMPRSLLRRLHRKAAVLQIENMEGLVSRLRSIFQDDIALRHPGLQDVPTETFMKNIALPWVECWNPDGYSGLREI